jgi:adenine phosphoribosyltransferase
VAPLIPLSAANCAILVPSRNQRSTSTACSSRLTDLRTRLRTAFTWLGDRIDEYRYAEVTEWWRDPMLLRDVGNSLADLFRKDQPTVIMGVEARGFILGPLVAVSLDVGFVEVRGQALGARRIVDDIDATWLGAAVVVDALESHAVRRELNVRSLMHHRELW